MGKKANSEHVPNEAANQAASAAVTSEVQLGGRQSRFKHPLSRKRVIVGSLVVLAILVVAVVLHGSVGAPSSTAPPKTADQKAQDIVSSYTQKGNQSAADLQASIDKLKALEKAATSAEQKQAYAAAIVQLNTQAGNNEAATTEAQQADATNGTALSAADLAATYEAQHDYANAAKYYRIAASRSPKTAPEERSAYNDYNLEAERLEAMK